MSVRAGNKIIITEEPKRICELCGKTAETRPYGTNGENICFPCGMLSERETKIQFGIKLLGMSHIEAEEQADKK